jgi:type I restriction enzyme S subunit
MDTDDLRIRRFGVIGDGYLGPAFHMRFKPGHVLYGSRRTYLRKVAVADFEGVTANTTYVLESSDPEALLPDLLPFIMQTESFTQHSVRESKGSVNPYVNFSDLAWFEFALPPIEEQKRTARLLMAARAAHEGLLEVVERGETLRDAWITRLIEFGTSGETRRETDMGRFPAAWDTQPLGERYDIQLGKMMSPKARSGDAQVPYMRNANVQWGRLDLSDVATMSIAEAERERFGLRPAKADMSVSPSFGMTRFPVRATKRRFIDYGRETPRRTCRNSCFCAFGCTPFLVVSFKRQVKQLFPIFPQNVFARSCFHSRRSLSSERSVIEWLS